MRASKYKSHTLWATTLVDLLTINIYTDPTLKGSWAITYVEEYSKKEDHIRPAVALHPDCFNDPEILDEILTHEFVHVLEYLFSGTLKKPDPADCTQYAIIIGRHLPKMLKYLKQVPNAKRSKKA